MGRLRALPHHSQPTHRVFSRAPGARPSGRRPALCHHVAQADPDQSAPSRDALYSACSSSHTGDIQLQRVCQRFSHSRRCTVASAVLPRWEWQRLPRPRCQAVLFASEAGPDRQGTPLVRWTTGCRKWKQNGKKPRGSRMAGQLSRLRSGCRG